MVSKKFFSFVEGLKILPSFITIP